MENKSNGLWKVILGIIIFIFVLNALSTGSLFGKLVSSVFSDNDTAYSYVHDEAGVLSSDTAEHINSVNSVLENRTGAEILVFTFSSLNGTDIADKAYSLFSSYEPGDSSLNNGVVIVFAVGENETYALQGRGIEDSLSAGTLRLMLNDAEELISTEGYDSGVTSVFDSISGHFEKLYSVSLEEGAYTSVGTGNRKQSLFDILGVVISKGTGIAKKVIKGIITAILVVFCLIAVTIITVITVQNKKKENSTGEITEEKPASAPNQQKENKNPYSKHK